MAMSHFEGNGCEVVILNSDCMVSQACHMSLASAL